MLQAKKGGARSTLETLWHISLYSGTYCFCTKYKSRYGIYYQYAIETGFCLKT